MDLIQRYKSLVAELLVRAQRGLKPWRLVAYSIGFSLFLNAGNAFCKDSLDTWNRISGPIPMVNQTPTQLLFLQPTPDRAEPYPENRCSLSLTTALTNLVQWGKSDTYYGYIDMEMIRTSIELKYGIFSGVEIGMSLPFVYGYGGFMDHFILEFEEWFNVARNLREKEKRYGRANTYTYFVKKNDKAFIEGKERSSGLGDLALSVKGKIRDEGDRVPCLSARFSAKIPTGDENGAFGSGEVDYGLGLLLQKTVKKATGYLNADVIFPGRAFEQEDVSLRTFYEIMLGAEYKLGERLSGLVQLSYITRPFEDTGLEMLDRRIWSLLLGVSYLTKTGLYIQGGLVEDCFSSSNTGADITFFLNVGKNF
jgi:hypothetical protein